MQDLCTEQDNHSPDSASQLSEILQELCTRHKTFDDLSKICRGSLGLFKICLQDGCSDSKDHFEHLGHMYKLSRGNLSETVQFDCGIFLTNLAVSRSPCKSAWKVPCEKMRNAHFSLSPFFSFYFSFPLSAGPVCERMVKRFHNLTNLPTLRVRHCDREPRKTSATQRTQTNQTTVAPHPTPAGVLKNYSTFLKVVLPPGHTICQPFQDRSSTSIEYQCFWSVCDHTVWLRWHIIPGSEDRDMPCQWPNIRTWGVDWMKAGQFKTRQK